MANEITNRVIKVSGEKIESMLVTEDSFQFLSKSCNTVEEFQEAFSKTLTMATKQEVKYEAIKSIKKEVADEDLSIAYKGGLGGNSVTFKFENGTDCEAFLKYCEKPPVGLTRNEVQLSPFQAMKYYLLGLLASLILVPFAYQRAVGLVAGEVTDPEGYSRSDRKGRFLNNILELLGPTGTLLVGILIITVLGYITWKRYSNPPVQIQLSR
jgi:hypothetical protein